MKELNLENGKARILRNKHEIDIRIGRKNDNYFIIYNSKSKGPFKKIFFNKTDAGNEIIGYNEEESKFYIINSEGLKLRKKEKLSLEDLESERINVSLDNCDLVIKINDYSIYIDNKSGKLLLIRENEKHIFTYYKEFDNHENLINHINENLKISTYFTETRPLLSKSKHVLIKFKDLYSLALNLNIKDLPEEILFDILTERSVAKKILDALKNKIFLTIYGDIKTNELIQQEYIDVGSLTYETLLKNYPDQINLYNELLKSKVMGLKIDCANIIKQTDNINFYKLESYLRTLSINELPRNAIAEISANRPLTKGIFMSMLHACFDKLEKDGEIINKNYRNSNNLKATYPSEYSFLWDIASRKLPQLCDEYFIERKKMLIN